MATGMVVVPFKAGEVTAGMVIVPIRGGRGGCRNKEQRLCYIISEL